MTKNKLTQKEKRSLMTLLIGIFAWTILQPPIMSLVNNLNISDLGQVGIGVIFLFVLYYFLKLN